MQPLYIDGSSPVDINWEEPALAITRTNESKRLMPLRLISHVLVSGREITWHQEALLACAEADIPILFTDSNNELIAALRTNTPQPSPEWRRLAKLIEDPDGVDHYRTFLKGKRSQIQREINERWTDLPDVRLPGYPRASRVIRIALRADLEAELHRRGFRQRTELLRDAGVDIGGDLMQLLEPYVHWLLNETWKFDTLNTSSRALPRILTRRELLHYYEQRADTLRDAARALVISFIIWLGEIETDHTLNNL